MDAAEIVRVAAENGLDDRESLVSFTLGFASGAAGRDSTEPVHLYGMADSIICAGIWAFLIDAKIPFEFHNVNIFQDEHLTQDFQDINIYHTLPTIKHGSYALHESSAILRYLCRAFPTATSKFYGNGDIQVQGFIDAALDERQIGLRSVALPTLYASIGITAKLSESESAKKFEDFNHRLALFHKHFLKHGRFVGGDHPSIADYLVQSLLLGYRGAAVYFDNLVEGTHEYIDDFLAAAPGFVTVCDGKLNGTGIGARTALEEKAKTFDATAVGAFNGAL